MAVLIDPPRWPAHGRLWSHLVSDSSLTELHALAAAAGLPRGAFDGDHYDVPAERFEAVVAAGAQAVDARALLHRLAGSGLRIPKRRGEKVLASTVVAQGEALAGRSAPGPQHLDVVASSHLVPDGATLGASLTLWDADARLLLARDGAGGWDLPGGPRRARESVAAGLGRQVREQTGRRVDSSALTAVGYLRMRPVPPSERGPRGGWAWWPLLTSHPDRWRGDDLAAPAGGNGSGAGWFLPGGVPLTGSALAAWPLLVHLLRLPT